VLGSTAACSPATRRWRASSSRTSRPTTRANARRPDPRRGGDRRRRQSLVPRGRRHCATGSRQWGESTSRRARDRCRRPFVCPGFVDMHTHSDLQLS
jgi:cytosine/adenosine deaminase-related metal-dependent hydrolase